MYAPEPGRGSKEEEEMMEKPYFVILNHQNSDLFIPMTDENDNLAMFDSEISAVIAGQDNPLGKAFGFEVFEMGDGVFDC